MAIELITVAAPPENGVIGRNGEFPWSSIPDDKRQYRTRIADRPVIFGRRTFDSMRDGLPGTAQIVLGRSATEYDGGSAHYAGGIDDAVATVESRGADRAYVIGGTGIYDLFDPVVDRTPHDGFPLEEWVRERS